MTKISKTLTALAVAATIAVAAVATPQPAEARGGRIAAGHHRRPGRRRPHRRGRRQRLLRLRVRPRLLLRAATGLLRRRLLHHPPAILGRLGLALSARAGLRLGG